MKRLTLVLCLALLATPSFAQTGNIIKDIAAARAKVKPAATTAAVATPAPVSTDPLTKLMNDLENVQSEVVAGVISDIQAADADAGTIVTPAVAATATTPAVAAAVKDPISHACYPAEVQFLQSLPTATPTTGKFIAVQVFQKKRDFVAQIQAGIPTYLKLGCAPLLGDEIQILTTSLAMIGVKVAANFALPGLGSLALPAL